MLQKRSFGAMLIMTVDLAAGTLRDDVVYRLWRLLQKQSELIISDTFIAEDYGYLNDVQPVLPGVTLMAMANWSWCWGIMVDQKDMQISQ